jgi:hypothetical protein
MIDPSRLTQHDVHLYVAGDTIDHIATRIRNLITGRDLTVITQYVGKENVHSFPEVKTNLRVNTATWHGGVEVSSWDPNLNHCGMVVSLTPGIERFGLFGHYATDKEAAHAYHSGDHRHQRNGIMYAHIVGGLTSDGVGQSSVIELVRTNENGVSEQTIIKPRVPSTQETIEAEAQLLDRVADHVGPGGSLTEYDARYLAQHIRDTWETGLKPTVDQPARQG